MCFRSNRAVSIELLPSQAVLSPKRGGLSSERSQRALSALSLPRDGRLGLFLRVNRAYSKSLKSGPIAAILARRFLSISRFTSSFRSIARCVRR